MARNSSNARQADLPRLEAADETHQRDCECQRCDAGFRPSEAQRRTAGLRWEERQQREAAAALLEKKRERKRIKALQMALLFKEEERRTSAHLEQQAELLKRLDGDERLDDLLRARRAGKPANQVLADIDLRFSARRRM